MRKFDFKSQSLQIEYIKTVIVDLVKKNYSIHRIQLILDITPYQMNEFLRYDYVNVDQKNNEDLKITKDSQTYNYDTLSPIEKIIYDNLK